jgi:hypothetical protein
MQQQKKPAPPPKPSMPGGWVTGAVATEH